MSKKEMEKMRTLLFAHIKYLVISNVTKRIVAHANSIKSMNESHKFYQDIYPNRNNINKRVSDYHCMPVKSMIIKNYSAFQRYVTERVIAYCYYSDIKYDSAQINQIIYYISEYYKDKYDMRCV